MAAPAQENQHLPVTVDLSNWLEAPYNRWSLHHAEQVVTTRTVRHGDVAAAPFAEAFDAAATRQASLDGVDFADFLDETCTDAVIVLHGRRVVYERYFGDMTPGTPHLAMSVSKSICGMLAGTLAVAGVLDLEAPVRSYVPELVGAGHGDSTVAEVLDMRVPLHFDMNYADPQSEVQCEDRCTGWRPAREGDPAGTRAFLAGLKADPGRPCDFHYCSATTDVLAWVLERASATPYANLLDQFWVDLGLRDDGYICVDGSGTPYACAGIGLTLRDLAAFGRVVLDGGVRAGRTVIPGDWIDVTRSGRRYGDQVVSLDPTDRTAAGYCNQWWLTGDAHGSFYARGIHGQYLWLDPVTDVVIAKFSSLPGARDQLERHVRALHAIAVTVGSTSK